MQPTSSRAPQSTSSTDKAGSAGRRILVNTGSLAGSSLWRIFVSFILQVLITRVLGVAEVGQYVSALAFLNVGLIVSELGLPALLVRDLAQHPTRRRGYYLFSLRVQVTASFATWAGLALLAWLLPLSPMTRSAIWVGGALLPFYAVTSASQTLFKASERMELVMGIDAVGNALILLLSLLVLSQGGGIIQLMGVLALAQAVSAGLCALLVSRKRLLSGPQEAVKADWPELWRAARPFYWISLADVLLHRLDVLLLNVLVGDFVTGIYSIAYSLMRVMTKLIQSYWQALYPTLSRLYHYASGQYQLLSSLSLRYGLMLVLPSAAIAFGIAPDLLQLLYGEDAAASIAVFRTLVWATPLFLVEMYAVTQLMTTGSPRLSLQITWIHIAAILLLLPLLTIGFGAIGAAAALSVASIVGTFWGVRLLRRRAIPCRVPRLAALLGATAVAVLLALMLPLSWPLRVVGSGGAYLVLLWLTGVYAPNDRAILREALRGRA